MFIPEDVQAIIERLDRKGEEAYLVGGCVRDSLLARDPHDYDIASKALPNRIEEVFFDYPTYGLGKKFGTIGVQTGKRVVEITTYRKDGDYLDHRRPESVSFSTSLEEDLRRRDFTINALAYHPKRGLLDPFGGREDLEKGVIRTVGQPQARFSEDALRILRALRFMGQLDFELSQKTQAAIREMAGLVQTLSRERIRDEIFKILLQDRPSRVFYKMEDLGLLGHLFPDLVPTVGYDQGTPWHDKTLFDHTLCVLDRVPKKVHLRLAALFHDIEKPSTMTRDPEDGRAHFYGHDYLGAETAARILRGYRASKDQVEAVYLLIKDHMKVHDQMTDKALRRQIRRVGEDLVLDLYDLMIADASCTLPGRDLTFLQERKARVQALLEEGVPSKKTLAISGRDIMELGLPQGPQVGRVLDLLEEAVLADPSINTRQDLLEMAEKIINHE